jgi:hypothetical protein
MKIPEFANEDKHVIKGAQDDCTARVVYRKFQ